MPAGFQGRWNAVLPGLLPGWRIAALLQRYLHTGVSILNPNHVTPRSNAHFAM